MFSKFIVVLVLAFLMTFGLMDKGEAYRRGMPKGRAGAGTRVYHSVPVEVVIPDRCWRQIR